MRTPYRTSDAFAPTLFAVALVSCTFPRTQTVVEIRADRFIETQASQLQIVVRDGNNGVLSSFSLNPQATDFPGFPLEIPISARGGDADRRFEVRVEALQNRRVDGGTLTVSLAENRVRTSFVRGQVSRVTLWLLAGCRCNPETERCVPDRDQDLVPECEPLEIAPAADAGLRDAGSVDASEADAVAVDAVTSDDASDGGPVHDGNVPVVCSATQHLCNGQCVSRFSPLFCGDGCEVCSAVSGASSTCENGACAFVCGASTPDRCGAACVDLESDNGNCGQCGSRCSANQLCQRGQCIVPPQCSPGDTTCNGLTYCASDGRCAPGCDRQSQCASDRMCNTTAHVCECRSDLRACGTSCVTCPNGGPIVATACNANACVVTACSAGFEPTANGSGCQDINECATTCSTPATCTNLAGSFTCACNAPNRLCSSQCVVCPTGAQITATGCAAQQCVVTQCSAGFVTTSDARACVDVNECLEGNGGCSVHATCNNNPGGRACNCNNGYTGNGIECTPVCMPNCAGRVCGPDGCAGSCGTCSTGVCSASGQCTMMASSWVQRSPTTSPPARGQHTMVYDAARQRVVLFGGWSSTTYFGDTWEWDGSNWTLRTPAVSPSARGEHAMVYDAGRQRVVVYGGTRSPDYFTETWEWSGSTWLERTTSPNPSYRTNTFMAYDAARQNSVLFGGLGHTSDTWLMNGGFWEQVSPASYPSARSDHAMAYDAARQQVVLFGGSAGTTRENDTWTWNGSNWTLATTAVRPGERSAHAMAYDGARQRVVLFGGNTTGTRYQDTWEWNGSAWSEVTTTPRPAARSSHAMVYDAARQEVVLFGGWSGSVDLADTWVYRSN